MKKSVYTNVELASRECRWQPAGLLENRNRSFNKEWIGLTMERPQIAFLDDAEKK